MMQNQVDSVDHAQSSALETAWQRYAQLDANASAAVQQYLSLRGWAMSLSVITTLLAIVTACADSDVMASSIGTALRAALVLVPIVSLVILILANKPQQGQYWQTLSTGAAEIKKAIYLYRTLLQGQEKRHLWLNEQVATIQREVSESLGGNLVLQPYRGNPPFDDSGEASTNDPSFSDLLADEYLRDRLDGQLEWYSQELARLHANRTALKIGIFGLGVLSAFLPVLGSNFNVWVAFTTSLATALIIWREVCQLDESLNTYNSLIVELNIIRDYWQSLNPEERTGDAFFKWVIATENVLWSAHNQPINQMRQAVVELQRQTSDLLVQTISQPAPTAINKALLPQKQVAIEPVLTPVEIVVETVVEQKPEPKAKEKKKVEVKKGAPHAFVVMPFGRKKGPDGGWIDFNSIYYDLIKPALEEAGFEPFRADEEAVSGDILTDMFQELLLADLVLADLSIDNANVFYELGVRHALRKRGLVHIQCGRAYMPYDIFNVRALPYHCDENGCPDPQFLEKDKQAIIKMARATWESDQNRIHSPIFGLLNGLDEPDRKALRTPLATGYWQEHKEWQQRIGIAKQKKRIGDVLLLTEEVKNPLIKEEALAEAGQALMELGNHALALKEYREGLKINSSNLEFRRQEAFNLSQLKQADEAIVKFESLLQDEPTYVEAISNLAHIYKEKWRQQWETITDDQERLKAAYGSVHFLTKSIQTYLNAYRLNQDDFYPGINALTLSAVLDYLAQQVEPDGDPEEEALRQQLPRLQGAVQFSLDNPGKNDGDYWLFASLGEFAVCTAQSPKQVTRAYKKALTVTGKSKFVLQSSLDQLELLEALNFRSEYAKAGIAALKPELYRVESQEDVDVSLVNQEPSQVLLFSGHMIDSPNRPQPRFPAAMESEARQRIEEILDKLNPCNNCLAIAPGIANGGDILFLEACLQRNMKVEVFLPFEQAEFIQQSVSSAGGDWVIRFYKIQNHPNVTINLQPDRLGAVPAGDEPFGRNNRWALYSTLMYGIDRTRLIVLWDGKEGFPGGTGDMVQEVRRLGGIIEHIDTTKFDYWKKENVIDSIHPNLLNDANDANGNSDKVHLEPEEPGTVV